MAIKSFLGAEEKKKPEKDQGALANVLGKALDVGTDLSPVGLIKRGLGQGDLISQEDAQANVRGVTDMLNLATVLPAFAGAGIKTARALNAPAILGLTRGDLSNEKLNEIDQSPLSFLVDTENLRKQRDQAAQGDIPNQIMAGIGTAAPVAQDLANAFAETGIRGGGALAAGISQTGLAGPKRTANEMIEQNAPAVESYGQANERGGAGAMLLMDLLNVAPALKGATGGGALNPLRNTALAGKVSNAGAALEQAPLMPISKAGQGIQEAIQKTRGGGTAFPSLAGTAAGETPVLSTLAKPVSAVAEKAAGGMGKLANARMFRDEAFKANARINAELLPQLDELTANIQQAVDAGDLVKATALNDEMVTLVKGAQQEGKAIGAYEGVKKLEDLAAKHGGETADTTVFGQVVDNTGKYVQPEEYGARLYGLPKVDLQKSGVVDYVSPGGRSLREAQGELAPKATETAPNFNVEGPPPAQGSLDLFGEGVPATSATDEIAQNVATNYGIKDINALRKIPKNFTEDSIEKAFKGLQSPSLPSGLGGDALKQWDKLMGAWKTTVLPVRPAWHASNIVGNVMGGLLLGEANPFSVIKNTDKILSELDNPTSKFRPVLGRGIGAEAAPLIEEAKVVGKTGSLRKRGSDVISKSYKAAEKVDDFSHMAVAMDRYEKNIARGLSEEAAVDESIAWSNKTMGDFGNMSAVERAFVRRAMPFYPWSKHVAKASVRFPIENPARFLQSQAFAQRLGGGQTPEGSDYLGNTINMGGGNFLKVGGDIGLGPGQNPLLNPAKFFGGLSPFLQMPAAAAGVNVGQGRMLQSAPGQNVAQKVAGYGINQFMPTKLAADLYDTARGEGNLTRGDTRGIKVSGGRPVLDVKQGAGFLPPELGQFLTGANESKPDLKGNAKRAKKAAKTEKKAEKNYQKAVKKSPKK